ncbi:MAG: hypothetical protein ACLU9S_23930 [Oscillospiraceae bacterium]
MNYFPFKLQFETAVHFGSSDAALSLGHFGGAYSGGYAVFCPQRQTALCLYGPEGVEALCGQVQEAGSRSSATPCPGGGIPCSFQSQ